MRAARAIKCRDVSCCEMMQAYLKHIDWLNPIVHALRLGVEQAALIALAHHRDTQLRPGEYLGWMHGAVRKCVEIKVARSPVRLRLSDQAATSRG